VAAVIAVLLFYGIFLVAYFTIRLGSVDTAQAANDQFTFLGFSTTALITVPPSVRWLA
jgi:hypothetical protein